MLTEEYGLPRQVRSPWRAALSTFSAFVLCGLTPLFPFAIGLPQAFGLAIALTAGVFCTIGAARNQWSPTPWWRSGLSTLAMGMTAAGLAVGQPAEQILRVAREAGVDLIAMGTHGRTGWRHAVLGSLAEAVLRQASCPVLTVGVEERQSSASVGRRDPIQAASHDAP
jgi:Universal stress protein family/VIT family